MTTLVDAARDRGLLGSTIEWWPKQLELLRSLEDPQIRTHVWAIGRQSGKTSMAAALAVHNATMRLDLDRVLPRYRKRHVLIVAPSEDQSKETLDTARALIEDSPLLLAMARFSSDRIDFDLGNGRRTCIRAMPANSKTLRSKSASLCIVEEHAHFDDTAGPGSDERIYRALRPSMRRFGEKGKVLTVSTPHGESGKFYELFRDAETGALPQAVAVRAPSWEVDPTYTQAQQDADRAELGEDGFAEEVGAEFVSGRGSFFDLEGVRFEAAPVPPEEGRRWVIGLDAAFSADMFGVAIVGESRSDPNRLVVGAVAALAPERLVAASQESLEDEHARQATMLDRVWEIVAPYAEREGSRGVSDLHKGGPVKSYFGRRGLAVTLEVPTQPRQMQMFVALKTRLEDASLRCWAHPQLVVDLRRVRAEGGRIHLPRFKGSHCDAAVALATAAFEFQGSSEGRIIAPPQNMRVPREADRIGRGSTRADMGGEVTDRGAWIPDRHPAIPAGTPDWMARRTRRILREQPPGGKR